MRAGTPGRDAVAGRDPLRRRRWAVLGVLAVSLVSAGGGLAGSLLVRSPQEVIAAARAPRPSVVTAAAQMRVVARVVAAVGQVAPHRAVPVGVGNLPGGVSPVVTAAKVHTGERIRAGQVIAEVAGLPVIALPGVFPAYRDIMPGDTGKDVAQLQAALADLGYPVSDAPGVFGASTQAAVASMFRDRGYTPPTVSGSGPSGGAGSSGAGGSNASGAGGSKAKTQAQAKKQVWLPAGDVAYLPKFPAFVEKVNASVGTVASKTLLTLSVGALRVVGCVSAGGGGLVRRGEAVAITVGGSGRTMRGKVAAVGTGAAGSAGSGAGNSCGGQQQSPAETVVVTARHGLPHALDGKQAQLLITAASTRHKVLAVPVAAIHATAGGAAEVVKVVKGGRQVTVRVTVGATGGGWVQVTPLGGGTLAAGDQVVVAE